MIIEYLHSLWKQKGSKDCCIIMQTDDALYVYPSFPQLTKALTIRKKTLDPRSGVSFENCTLYAEAPSTDDLKVLITYQGFLQEAVAKALLAKKMFSIVDKRISIRGAGFPAPRMDLMYGFRFSQRELLEKALKCDCSGLIGAPTRYGKTTLIVNTLRAFPNLTTVVTAPGVDLVKQLYNDITGERGIRNREVKLICTGKSRTPAGPGGVTVCSANSLEKCDVKGTQLLLIDEPHDFVTATRAPAVNAFTQARRIGFGATLKGRFDAMDPLITGLFGPILAERTYTEAVEEGAICPLEVIFIRMNISDKNYRTRDGAYNKILFRSRQMAHFVKQICLDIIPQDFQTMLFVKEEQQADMLMEAIPEGTIAMAKKLTNKEREEVDRLMKNNIIKRCICTKIYIQGVTFPDVRVLVNLAAGGNNTSAIQKPGRLAQVRPGKKCGIFIDFLFEADPKSAAYALELDSRNRMKAYTAKGYGIHIVQNINELKDKFNALL